MMKNWWGHDGELVQKEGKQRKEEEKGERTNKMKRKEKKKGEERAKK